MLPYYEVVVLQRDFPDWSRADDSAEIRSRRDVRGRIEGSPKKAGDL